MPGSSISNKPILSRSNAVSITSRLSSHECMHPSYSVNSSCFSRFYMQCLHCCRPIPFVASMWIVILLLYAALLSTLSPSPVSLHVTAVWSSGPYESAQLDQEYNIWRNVCRVYLECAKGEDRRSGVPSEVQGQSPQKLNLIWCLNFDVLEEQTNLLNCLKKTSSQN